LNLIYKQSEFNLKLIQFKLDEKKNLKLVDAVKMNLNYRFSIDVD